MAAGFSTPTPEPSSDSSHHPVTGIESFVSGGFPGRCIAAISQAEAALITTWLASPSIVRRVRGEGRALSGNHQISA